ncbi:MAG: hypothetical protein JNL39_04635 [Opitutaceae bacterium]|nr:hypothetical protein [Opitutaceae bacterium]
MKRLLCIVALAAGLLRGADSAPVAAGKVVETMNASSYTYVLLDAGAKKTWIAAPRFEVKPGDTVAAADGMPMTNYHSKSLNRTFDLIYFSGAVTVNGQAPAGSAADVLPAGHPPIAGGGAAASPHSAPATPAAPPDLTNIKRAAGGQTVAEIVTDRAKLSGKSIAVRGRVVKFNGGILGKNWLHVRDGSGGEGTNNLVVTTTTAAKVGDLVLVTGRVATNRDFGGGYKYAVIIEDAAVKVE